jgi:DNA helicase-2/ATP-dependent DNA helicase PcrA
VISLDEEQLRVAKHTTGALVVVATAGSGKTTAITHRIASVVESGAKSAENGLALTFTNKSAQELKLRLQSLGISQLTTGTFHAVALRQLSYFWPQVFGGSIWPIQARTTLLSTLTQNFTVTQRRYIEAEIDWLKSSGLDATSYSKLQRDGEVSTSEVAEIYGRYQDLTHSKRVIDFDDILQLTVGLLTNHPEILKEVRKRYTWFTVDEFQDVTPIQNALLRLWVGEREDICVVGDPAQTIYSFAGARAEYLNDFWLHNASRLFLSRTYRCPRAVTALAQSLMANTSTPVRMHSHSNADGAVITLTASNEYEEARLIAHRIQDLLNDGVSPEEIAVLVRLGSMSQYFEKAFEELNIPFSLRGARPFFDRSEIKEVLLALRQGYEASNQNVRELILKIALHQGWTPESQSASESGRQVWESITGLLNLADQLGSDITLGDFFHNVALLAQQNLAPVESVVTIATLHSAKGLEWEHVFVPGLVEGVLPYSEASLDEERRLLFVGITRSKQTVTLTMPAERLKQATIPSRFLTEMNQNAAEVPLPEVSRNRIVETEVKDAIRCRICQKGLSTATENALRRCETCESDSDPEILKELFAWRGEFATATNQIDWLVLTDVTLQALSELKPRSMEDLHTIHGLNATNLAAFGDDLLRIMTSHD